MRVYVGGANAVEVLLTVQRPILMISLQKCLLMTYTIRWTSRIIILRPFTLVMFEDSGLQQLKSVLLNHNKISITETDAFSGLGSAVYRNLSHNNISTVRQGAFRELTASETLSLSHLQNSAFKDIKNLRELDLKTTRLNPI